MSPETWDWLRWLNAGLSGLVVILLVMGAVARWAHMPSRFQRIAPWVIFTYVILAYGSGEVASADSDVDPGLRVGLLVLNLCGLIVALLWRIGDADYSE